MQGENFQVRMQGEIFRARMKGSFSAQKAKGKFSSKKGAFSRNAKGTFSSPKERAGLSWFRVPLGWKSSFLGFASHLDGRKMFPLVLPLKTPFVFLLENICFLT